MKYFTPELFSKYSSFDKEIRDKAEKQLDINDEEYEKKFNIVKGRLTKAFLKVYSKEKRFHDYKLRNFQIIQEKISYKNPVSVSMEVFIKERAWKIIYKGVTKIQINYEDENYPSNDKRCFQYGFDDYLDDEFLEVDNNMLSHEILFASYASVLIHFKRISVCKIV